MSSERQINSLPGLLAVKMIRQQISLTNRLTHQSTTLTNERRQWRTRADHGRLKSGPSLTRGLNVHKNIPVSITKLTLGLRVGIISSHLIADKLFPVNPRAITGPPKMSLLLEAKSMPALIIKPRFFLSLKKRGNIPNGSMPPYRSNYNNIRLTSLDLKAKVVCLGDGW